MPSVTDWISSIGSLIGALTGVGALIVAVLSYRRSTRALAADARTRGAVSSTVEAVEALGRAEQFDAMLDAALIRRGDAETHDRVPEPGYITSGKHPEGEEGHAYLAALEIARQELRRTP